MKKTTDELLKTLSSVHTEAELSDFAWELAQSGGVPSFSDYLKEKMQERDISPSELWKASQIPRNYGYNILRGERHPGRDKVLALCLALGFSCEETQRALKVAGVSALYPRRQRDAMIIFSLERGRSVMDTNILLDEFSQKPLG